ncbi:uncharacterized protein LOC117829331 [Xyrichtys novacula]|uniref:Uncharacterized protein LOC117829331 n=1 Tax=Xyrichtys novacula TaxID=13765 RepID=A0AAV1HBM3_XYRNO|nr:uncharacterized protein LOC117829331 [Xyrichtys novacula]
MKIIQTHQGDFSTMAKHQMSLLAAMVAALICFIVTMAFSALAASGKPPFVTTTGNISDEFVTEITPSGWTFAIWGIIYFFLAAVMVYVFSGIFRKNSYGYVYCSPAVLPYGFFIFWCLNMILNLSWLLVWDRSLMAVALVFIIFIVLTNYAMIFFSCHGLSSYGAWLSKYHKVDLWLHRVLVQNGIAIYATWTTIATLVNLTIVLVADAKMSNSDAALLALSLLTVILVVWFILENSVLDKHVRYILSIYPSVIWALTGVFDNNYNTSSPSRNNIFIGEEKLGNNYMTITFRQET